MVDSRLKVLYELQLIDDQLDELEELRGDLPNSINSLNARLESLTEQINDKKNEQNESLEKRKHNEDEIERLHENQKKFKAQLYQVRNNKEYDALTKEIDHSDEQITKLEAENKALEDLAEKLKNEIAEIEPQISSMNEELEEKREDLKEIVKANEKEEAKLREKRKTIEEKVRKGDYSAYTRIRKAKGGKAISPIVREACSGCHNVLPPQRNLEIKQNRRLYNCEYCGRILVSSEIAEKLEAEAK